MAVQFVGASGLSSCAPWDPRRCPDALWTGQDGLPWLTRLLAALHGVRPARAALLAGRRAMPVQVAQPVRAAELVPDAQPVRVA
jgi:hypothetical protein